MRRRVFTVLELLVVVAVLSVLIALTCGAVRHIRESGRGVQCSSHLRQLGVAFYQFATEPDNQHRFPRTDWNSYWGYWPEATWSYYRSFEILLCPSDANPFTFDLLPYMPITSEQTRDAYIGQAVSYRGSCETMPYSLPQTRLGPKVSSYAQPGRTMMLDEICDSKEWPLGKQCTIAEYAWHGWTHEDPSGIDFEKSSSGLSRHSGGANWLMADGSARWFDVYSGPAHVSYRLDGLTAIGF